MRGEVSLDRQDHGQSPLADEMGRVLSSPQYTIVVSIFFSIIPM